MLDGLTPLKTSIQKMIKEYLVPVAIVVVGLIVYNLLVKKFLPASFEENFEVDSDGRVMRAA